MILEDLFRNPLHLLTLLFIVMLVMGGTRLKDTMGSLGTGIKEFKKNIRDEDPPALARESAGPASLVVSAGNVVKAPAAVQAIQCGHCSFLNPMGSRHCNQCGADLVSAPTTTSTGAVLA